MPPIETQMTEIQEMDPETSQVSLKNHPATGRGLG